MLIAMAGLPGTGKSRLGQALAEALQGVILDKDTVRAALFPPDAIEYSTTQDDLCVWIMLLVAADLFRQNPQHTVILDGRPFARRYQRDVVVRAATTAGVKLALIECVCSEATAKERIEGDAGREHLARNRDFTLYQRLKAAFEPIEHAKLVVDTDRPFDECLETCLAYVHRLEAGIADSAATAAKGGT
jgi:predicted kinase